MTKTGAIEPSIPVCRDLTFPNMYCAVTHINPIYVNDITNFKNSVNVSVTDRHTFIYYANNVLTSIKIDAKLSALSFIITQIR